MWCTDGSRHLGRNRAVRQRMHYLPDDWICRRIHSRQKGRYLMGTEFGAGIAAGIIGVFLVAGVMTLILYARGWDDAVRRAERGTK